MDDVSLTTSDPPLPESEAGWLFITGIIATMAGIVSQVILTHRLGASDYGLYILILDLSFTILVFLDPGLSALITRDVYRLGRRGHNGMNMAVLFQFMIGLFLTLISGVLIYHLLDSGLEMMVIIFFSGGVAFHILSMTHRGALRSYGLARHEAISRLIERGGMALCFSIAAVLGVLGLSSYLMITTVCLILGSSWSFWNWQKIEPKQNAGKDVEKEHEFSSLRLMLISAIPFGLGYWMTTLNLRLSKLILGALGTLEDVAIFGILMLVISAVLILPVSIQQAIVPAFGRYRMDAQDTGEEMAEEVMLRARRMSLYGTLIGYPLSLVLFGLFFPIVFGPIHSIIGSQSIVLFSILMIGWVSQTMTSPELSYSIAGRTPWAYVATLSLTVVIQFVLCLLLFPRFGLMGVASSISIGHVVANFLLMIWVLNENSFVSHVRVTLDNTLFLFISIMIATSFNHPSIRMFTIVALFLFLPYIAYSLSADLRLEGSRKVAHAVTDE